MGLGLLKDTAVVVPGQRTVKRVIAEMEAKTRSSSMKPPILMRPWPA